MTTLLLSLLHSFFFVNFSFSEGFSPFDFFKILIFFAVEKHKRLCIFYGGMASAFQRYTYVS